VIKVRDEALIKAFGEHVRKLRKERGLTLESLAGKGGIDARQLSYIELGQTNVTISTINALAKAFNISISELIKLENF
jgi:transcriptional regulator with XRE-family HTH domain